MRSKSKELMLKIRDFAEQFTLEYSRTPSTAEIGEALGISKATAFNYLKEMHQQGMITYEDGVLHTRVTNKLNAETVNIPIVGVIPCGSPEEQIENTEEYITLPKSLLGSGDITISGGASSVTVLTGTSITLTDNSVNTLTLGGNTTFTLPTVSDVTIFHQILVQLNILIPYTIDLGTTTYFGGTAPDLSVAGNYNLIYEYDNALSTWVVGVIDKD